MKMVMFLTEGVNWLLGTFINWDLFVREDETHVSLYLFV